MSAQDQYPDIRPEILKGGDNRKSRSVRKRNVGYDQVRLYGFESFPGLRD
jgi:hypothetical protein